jgi:hypothetical protein
LIQPLAPNTAPCSRRRIRRTSPSTTLQLWVQVVVQGYLLHWWHLAASRVPPFLCCIPLNQSANQIPMRRGRPPLASVTAPCSHPWFLGPVIWRNALGRSLPLMDIRGGAPCSCPLAAVTVLGGFLLPLPPAPPTPPYQRCIIRFLAVLSAMNPIGPPIHRVMFSSPPSLSLWIGSPSLPSSLAQITSSQGTSFSTGFQPLVFPLPARIRSW